MRSAVLSGQQDVKLDRTPAWRAIVVWDTVAVPQYSAPATGARRTSHDPPVRLVPIRSAVSWSTPPSVKLDRTPAWAAIVVWDTVAASPYEALATGARGTSHASPVKVVPIRSAVSWSTPPGVALDPAPAWSGIVVWDTVAASPRAGAPVTTVVRQVSAIAAARERRARQPSAVQAVLRIASLVVLLAVLVTWFLYFRPQALGGPAEFVGVNGISMTPTLRLGDLAIVEKQASYHVGEIVVYRIPKGDPGAGDEVIHRIVGGNGTTGFVTKGDHNHYTDHFWHPKTQDVIGAVWFHIPRGALVLSKLHDPIVLAIVVAVLTLTVLAWPLRRRKGPPPGHAGDAVVISVPERRSERAA